LNTKKKERVMSENHLSVLNICNRKVSTQMRHIISKQELAQIESLQLNVSDKELDSVDSDEDDTSL